MTLTLYPIKKSNTSKNALIFSNNLVYKFIQTRYGTTMVDILDEVREELKDERALNFIKQHGKFILTLMVACIIGASLKIWWNDYQENKAHKAGGDFITAILKMRAYKPDEAVKKFESLFSNDSTNYAAFAGLNVASYSDFKKDYAKSSVIYNSVSENNDFDKSVRDLARFLAIKSKISSNGDKQELASELEKYISENGIYKYSSLEILGSIYLDLGNKAKAKEIFNTALTDAQTPDSIRNRISTLIVLTN